jgi:hypothetical protein
MRLGRNVKIGIGVATWLIALTGFLCQVLGVYEVSRELWAERALPSLLDGPLVAVLVAPLARLAQFVFAVPYIGLAVLYLVYLVSTRRLGLARKLVWGVGILLLGWMIMPLFFHLYVWPTREEFLQQRDSGR